MPRTPTPRQPHWPVLPRTARLRWLATVLGCLLAGSAFGLDYETNDVSVRELAVGVQYASVDVDTRVKGNCPGTTAVCTNLSQPWGTFVRGAARRHRRYFYLGWELQVGTLFPTTASGARPWLFAGGMAGGETSASSFAPIRGYAEAGLGAAWANTRLGDSFQMFAEGGVRYRLLTRWRPHWTVSAGIRATSNFALTGVQGNIGLGWAFD